MGLSPDQLRRTYQKSRQRVIERRERANTLVSDSSHRERTDSLPTVVGLRERSSTTLSDFAMPPSRRLSSSSTSSLTDITNIGILEKHKKTTTTVIRRKKGNKLPRDPTKRLSAPLMDSLKLPIENDTSVASLRQQLASMSVPDLTQHSMRNEPCLEQHTLQPTSATSSPTQRKLSDESSKRLKEARARQEWRMSRLKSFEGVLSQANSWMRDAKTKHHDENSTKESKPIKSDAPQNAPIANENNNATEVSYPIKPSYTNNEDLKLSKIDHSDI
ncbi:uncharacterized protein [Clytia hemisphaerica]|uniref:uncharacterized protein n=1 Tax=Clytia hemisphaerica TaxID=252671 RepID=UPI0034D6E505